MMEALKKLNAADYISLYRIVSSPLILHYTWHGKRKKAGSLLTVNFISDAVDGFIARAKNISSKKGAMLDSIGDVFTLGAGVVALIKFERLFFRRNKELLMTGLGLYVFQLTLSLIKYGKITSFHTYGAKVSAILQAYFLIKLIMKRPDSKLFKVMYTVSLLEIIEEIALVIKLNKYQTDIRSILTK
ncbi:CDP-alcohol phosphatidyltransferase family protein [Cytophagaceae bacterium ABcell3]|nr:CDP-alcohol phosphatidyltransferase family protein [Cytophagaceae bacterium ABcell3]